jgi:glycosyltransferase involved in cell wall biosynthesis
MNSKKKILICATVYTHIASFHKPDILMMLDKGYEVHVVANPDHGRKGEIQELGAICWDIPFSRSPFNKSNITSISLLRSLFKQHYFEIIHTHTPVASFVVRYTARNMKQGKVIYSAHGFHFFKGAPLINWILYYPMEYIASKWTDALIVMNEEDYNYGKKLGFGKQVNLFNLNGVGVDLSVFNSNTISGEIREEINVKSDDIMITCVSEFIPRKNHLLLLKVWEEVSKRYTNVHLVLVGKGREEEMIKKIVFEKKIQNVFFMGFRTDVSQIIADSDIIVLFSKHEGLPRCIMEAMACAKPVIVSDVRGSRDLVENNLNGYVVDIENIENITNSFYNLIENSHTRTDFGQNGKEKILDYSLGNVLKDLEHIYSKLLAKE